MTRSILTHVSRSSILCRAIGRVKSGSSHSKERDSDSCESQERHVGCAPHGSGRRKIALLKLVM